MIRPPRASLIAVALWLAWSMPLGAQGLVTPVRIGNPDAPMRLTVWAQQDYSHLAALPSIAHASMLARSG